MKPHVLTRLRDAPRCVPNDSSRSRAPTLPPGNATSPTGDDVSSPSSAEVAHELVALTPDRCAPYSAVLSFLPYYHIIVVLLPGLLSVVNMQQISRGFD